jgi:glyoxylase-like metal-dependent hydrolase (beta-lactamase superfamily II)
VTALPDVSDAPEPRVGGDPVEVAVGVHVIPDRRVPLVPNIGIVVGDHAALVIDTGLGQRNAEYVLSQAKRLANDRPLYLTITHFHPEHGFGAQVFKGEATIVYNRAQRAELRRKGQAYLHMFTGLAPAIAAELVDVELTEPDITYDGGQAEIDLGGRKAELRASGPAHTSSDQTILVDGKVLFTGDLAETRMFPIAPYFPPHDTDVDPGRWITVMDELLALQPEIVVPGHGEVTDATLLTDVRDYLTHIRERTDHLRAEGAGPDDAVAAIEAETRSRWSSWDNPEWIGFMVHATYNTATYKTKASDQG